MDAEVARRPHGHHTTVVMHLDVQQRAAALHLGPLLSEPERRYLTVMPPMKSGSNVTAWSSAAADRPVRSTAGFAVPLSTATPRARFQAAAPPAVCTHTTSGTGKTAAPPSWTTWCWYAPIITGCTIAASSPSPDPHTTSASPTAPADH